MSLSLFEALVALLLDGLVLAMMTATLSATALVVSGGWQLHAELLREAQIEQLIARAVVDAGSGPARPPPLAGATSDSVVLLADLDANGRINSHSAEHTAIELRRDSPAGARLLHRIGRQAMTIEQGLPASSALAYYDRRGTEATDMGRISLLRVPGRRQSLLFALPRRLP